MNIARYFAAICGSLIPLTLYMKYVMDIGLKYDNPLIMLGFGVVLMLFSEILQLRIKK